MSESRARLRYAHLVMSRSLASRGTPRILYLPPECYKVTRAAEHYRNVPILSGGHLGLLFDLSELALDLLLFDELAATVQKK